MESTVEEARLRTESGNNGTLRRRAARATGEWQNLLADVEDLVKKVADVSDVEVARVRERVERTLAAAKSAAREGAATARTYARDATVATDEYVHDRPWTAIGVAVALGVLIGFFASRR
jgi:ElaB/YqjD/DUF883 family membrane-anchored ribosome-binding protein